MFENYSAASRNCIDSKWMTLRKHARHIAVVCMMNIMDTPNETELSLYIPQYTYTHTHTHTHVRTQVPDTENDRDRLWTYLRRNERTRCYAVKFFMCSLNIIRSGTLVYRTNTFKQSVHQHSTHQIERCLSCMFVCVQVCAWVYGYYKFHIIVFRSYCVANEWTDWIDHTKYSTSHYTSRT